MKETVTCPEVSMVEEFAPLVGMTSEQYQEFHKTLCDEARALSASKNNDYAAPEENRDNPNRIFRNFTLCEVMGIASTEAGFLVRLCDKFSRLSNLLKPEHIQTVKDESLKDTMKDIVNYTVLLAAYLENKKNLNGK